MSEFSSGSNGRKVAAAKSSVDASDAGVLTVTLGGRKNEVEGDKNQRFSFKRSEIGRSTRPSIYNGGRF